MRLCTQIILIHHIHIHLYKLPQTTPDNHLLSAGHGEYTSVYEECTRMSVCHVLPRAPRHVHKTHVVKVCRLRAALGYDMDVVANLTNKIGEGRLPGGRFKCARRYVGEEGVCVVGTDWNWIIFIRWTRRPNW